MEEDDELHIVYMHTCHVTGKSYIGITKKSIEERWSEHVALAFDRRPRSKYRKYHFQNAIKEHGIESWDHVVLVENIVGRKNAGIEEMRLIRELGTISPRGYNETSGGAGVSLTREGRERHRLATREALHRPDVRARFLAGIRRGHSAPEFIENNRVAQKLAQCRPDVAKKKCEAMREFCGKDDYVSPVAWTVEQLTKDGEHIATYGSVKLAALITGANYSKITEVARGLRQFTHGCRWRYLRRSKEHD